MKHARLPFVPLSKCFLAVIAGLVALLSAATGFARGDAAVVYDPVLQPLGSVVIPFQSHYTLSITSPENYPTGVSSSITFVPTVNDSPDNVDDATALSYLGFSVSSLTFTGPLQTQTVVVSLNVPANAVTGAYAYQFKTAGWPSVIADLGGYTDLGAAVNMTATTGPLSNPPAVTIATPNDMSVITVPYTSLPVTVPLRFVASATANDPVTRVDADLLGFPITLDQINGLGSATVVATGNMSVALPGDYTVQARGTNLTGTASDANTFTVVVTAPPPTVAIAVPLDRSVYSYTAGATALNIPFTFTALSTFGGIRTLEATLDGDPVTITTTPLGLLSVTGNALLALAPTVSGDHVLSVTATDDYGSDSDTHTITINVNAPTPAINITLPVDNAVLIHTTGTPALNVPFTFVTTTTAGFKVDSVSAALVNNATNVSTPVTITATVGLGGVLATSTGTLNALPAGSYTLIATGVSAGITVTDSNSFTIKESQAAPVPPTVVINQPPINSTYTIVRCGPALNIPFSFTGSAASGNITRLTATLDGRSVLFTTSGLNTLSATGTGTLCVSSAGTHTLAVTATNSQGTATTSRKFTVVEVTPTLTLSISQPTDGAIITRVAGSPATSVPFSFAAVETNGTVTSFSATFNCKTLSITSTGFNTGSATGTGTLSVSSAGTFTLSVTAKGTGGLTTTKTVKITVKETQPAPPPCTYNVTWIKPSTSCGSIYGGCNVDVSFQIQQTCKSSSSCGGSNTTTIKDTTAVVSIYEIYSNGRTGTPRFYTYTTSSASTTKFAIDYKNRYLLSCPTSSGTHRYHIEVNVFPSGSTTPKLVGTKEFTTR